MNGPSPTPCPSHEATACQPGHPDDPSLCKWCGQVCEDAPSAFWAGLPDGPTRRPAALAQAHELWIAARAAKEESEAEVERATDEGTDAEVEEAKDRLKAREQESKSAFSVGFALRRPDTPAAPVLLSLAGFAEGKGAKVLAAYLRDAAALRAPEGSPSSGVTSFFSIPTQGRRAAPEGFEHCQWVGADDVDFSVAIDLTDVPNDEDVIGILIHKAAPDADNLFGYSPMWHATWAGARPEDYETDDIHTSLPELCRDYGLPLDLVVDRVSVALLRLAQEAPTKKAPAPKGGAS